jgi:hypothetical protein
MHYNITASESFRITKRYMKASKFTLLLIQSTGVETKSVYGLQQPKNRDNIPRTTLGMFKYGIISLFVKKSPMNFQLLALCQHCAYAQSGKSAISQGAGK